MRNHFISRIIPALLLAGGLLVAGSLRAQVSITVTNFDFETDGLPDNSYTSGTIPTGWTMAGTISPGAYGYFNPTDALGYTGTDGSGAIDAMSGPNIFYFGSARNLQGIQQTLTTNFAANTDYTLTVALGLRRTQNGTITGDSGTATPLRMELLAGATVLASNIVFNGVQNSFTSFSLNYSANPTNDVLDGQALTIRLTTFDNGVDGDTDIDNVRLTSIPEPSTYAALLGLAGLGVAFIRRRAGR